MAGTLCRMTRMMKFPVHRCIRARAPKASSSLVRKVMQANAPRDTVPEVRLRSKLHSLGLRFWKDRRPEASYKCSADVVFPSARVCVFVDGCFWHGCPNHFKGPRTNAAWWREKIGDNAARDLRQTKSLRRLGWCVVRVWEHELVGALLPRTAIRIKRIVCLRRGRRMSTEAGKWTKDNSTRSFDPHNEHKTRRFR